MRLLIGCLLAICTVGASAAEFQIKGVSLGMSPQQACKGEPVTTEISDIVRDNLTHAPKLRTMRTHECMLPIENFGGYPALEPATLIFMDGRLVTMKIEMASVAMDAVANLVSALTDEYGRPQISRSNPFTTHRWRKGPSMLEFERTSRTWDDNDLVVILRDEPRFKIFQADMDHNQRELAAAAKKAHRKLITE